MYRGWERETHRGGAEKCTMEGWRGGEMPKCDRQSDTQTHRKVFL